MNASDPPRTPELLLLAALESGAMEAGAAGRVYAVSLGRAQWAVAAATRWPQSQVTCSFLDVFAAEQAQQTCGAVENLQIECASDWPEEPCRLVTLPVSRSGESELTRELIQTACLRLEDGGQLWAAVDQPQDRWLRQELETVFGKVKVWPIPADASDAGSGVVYCAEKAAPLKRRRDFDCEFAFRDHSSGQLLKVVSRPGVFSHRRLDVGARKLIESLEFSPSDRLLDIGCGSGGVALAAAARAPLARVHAIDSNIRAVDCTLVGAQLNGLTNLTAEVAANGPTIGLGTYTVATANPPYYSGFQLAELFLDIAYRSLAPGGRCLLVTKFPDWYVEHAGQWLTEANLTPAGEYWLLRGVRAE